MADEPGVSGGQNLGWWKETAPMKPVSEVHRPWWQGELTSTAPAGVALRSEPTIGEIEALLPDIGEELEAEALRLAAAEERGEQITFLANPPAYRSGLKLQTTITLSMTAAYGLLPLFMPHPRWYHGPDMYHQPYFWIEWAVLTLFMLAILKWSKAIGKQVDRPGITLTKAGIEIHQMGYDLGLIRWDEIDDISLSAGYVGILPTDTLRLCRRLTFQQSAMTRTNHLLASPMFFLPKRLRAPIPIGTYLSVPPSELLARIKAFRAQNSV